MKGKKKLKGRDRFLFITLALLGLICVLNVNAVANKFFGVERFFSPAILLLCVVGVLFSGKQPVKKLGKYGIWFLGGYMAYMVFGSISAYVEGNMGRVTGELFRYVASIAVASATILLTRQLVTSGNIDRVMRFVFWLSIASAGTIFVSYLFPALNAAVGVGHRVGRSSGFFANPNELATQTLLTVAFGFGMASRTLNIKYMMIAFAVGVPAVLGSHSRSAIVGMAAIIATLSFLVFPAKYVIRTALSLVIVGAVGLAGMSYLQSLSEGSDNSALKRRTDQMFDFLRGDISGATTGGRFELGKEAIDLWKEKPFIGHGLGFMNEMPFHRVGPHNMIFKMLGDSGFVGTGALALFWLMFLLGALRCKIRWLKVTLLGIFMAVSFNLMSAHTGISRRFLVYQLSVMVALLEPATQKIIARGGDLGGRFMVVQPRYPIQENAYYPPHPPQVPIGRGVR